MKKIFGIQKSFVVVFAICTVLGLFRVDVIFGAAKTPKAVLIKDIKQIKCSGIPSSIIKEVKKIYADDVKNSLFPECDAPDEYMRPVGYSIELNKDHTNEWIVSFSEGDEAYVEIFMKKADSWMQIGSSSCDILKFGPSNNKNFLDIFMSCDSQDGCDKTVWKLTWNGKKYAENSKKVVKGKINKKGECQY